MGFLCQLFDYPTQSLDFDYPTQSIVTLNEEKNQFISLFSLMSDLDYFLLL